jgi:hypothetical protein
LTFPRRRRRKGGKKFTRSEEVRGKSWKKKARNSSGRSMKDVTIRTLPEEGHEGNCGGWKVGGVGKIVGR